VGAKVKFLAGKANISSKSLNSSIFTSDEAFEWTLKSDIHVNSSLHPGLTSNNQDFKFGEYFFNGKNKGLALDLGATYKYDDNITITASVLDIGFIRWKENPKNYKNQNNEWTFAGIDVDEFIGESDSIIEEKIDNTVDSLIDKFDIQETNDKYTTWLTTTFYVGGTYELTSVDQVGLLFRNEVFAKRLRTSVSASYQREINEHFMASASWSLVNRNMANFGLGFTVKFQPFLFYFATDNVPAMFVADKMKFANVHFGINWILGGKDGPAPLILY
jgi:hypothetical protein